jgi:hypothetical protein
VDDFQFAGHPGDDAAVDQAFWMSWPVRAAIRRATFLGRKNV